MASTINAKTTGVGGIDATGDASGVLALQTAGVTALSISAAQVATFVNPPVMSATGLTGDIAAARITTALNASGSAPVYACRAWVNFNGTGTVAIRASGNVSSITDLGVGSYSVNLTTAMPDANYAGVGSTQGSGVAVLPVISVNQGNNQTTSLVNIYTTSASTATPTDFNYVTVSIFR